MLNKPELNDWKPVEIEIVNHENIRHVNEGDNMMRIRLLSPMHINTMPVLHHATATEHAKVTLFLRRATDLDIIIGKKINFFLISEFSSTFSVGSIQTIPFR